MPHSRRPSRVRHVRGTPGPAKGAQVAARHHRRLSCLTVACSVSLGVAAGPATAQAPGPPAAGSIRVQPSPSIAGVIDGGTLPQVITTGLNGADDPIWLPEVGLVFAEPGANRVV